MLTQVNSKKEHGSDKYRLEGSTTIALSWRTSNIILNILNILNFRLR